MDPNVEHEIFFKCPCCLHELAAHPSLAGRVCMCPRCGKHRNIPEGEERPLTDTDRPQVFADPLDAMDGLSFFTEGCATLAGNVAALLRLAGEPVTPAAITQFVRTLPRYRTDLSEIEWRSGHCNKVMKAAHYRLEDDAGRELHGRLMDYFIRYIPARKTYSLDMLDAAFAGVLTVEFDREPCKDLVKYRKRGPLERFAERMGW